MQRKFGQSNSRFLKSEHLAQPDGTYRVVPVAIEGIEAEEVNEEYKYLLLMRTFDGKPVGKPLILNATNEKMLIALHGVPDQPDLAAVSAHYKGKLVELYVDPDVFYSGKRTPGLRIREYTPPAQPQVVAQPQPVAQPADDIPF